MQKTIEFLNANLDNNDTVIIGVSGGPDSMCLLSLLCNLKKNLKIVVAFVDHKTRKQIIKEEKYVKDYCIKNNLIFEKYTIDEKINNDFENKARKIRYNFFNDLKNKYKAKYILTAHHADDEIETILMRLVRGSNLSGYLGIKPKDNIFLRPLLFASKDDILRYLKDNNIKYFIDKTNKQNNHTRNKYRHYLLPFLKKENPLVHEKFLQFSNELNDYNEYINRIIAKKKLINNNTIDIEKLKKEDSFIQKKTIESLIKVIQKDYIFNITNSNIAEIIKLLNSKKTNSMVSLPDGFIGIKEYGKFKIIKDNFKELKETEFIDFYEDDNWLIKKDNSDKKSNYIIRINSKEIKLPLYIRSKKDGDKISLKNSGTKKISDIFITSKVKKEERNIYPLLVDSNDSILWIPGLKKSKFDKEKNEKYDIILLAERKNHEKY